MQSLSSSETYPVIKAGRGWAVLASYILAYDIWALKTGNETLSGAFWRALEHPVKRWLVTSSVVIVSKHLVAPKFLAHADPIGLIVWLVRKSDFKH